MKERCFLPQGQRGITRIEVGNQDSCARGLCLSWDDGADSCVFDGLDPLDWGGGKAAGAVAGSFTGAGRSKRYGDGAGDPVESA